MILELSQNINDRMCDVRNSVILEPKQQPVFYFLHGTSVFYFSLGPVHEFVSLSFTISGGSTPIFFRSNS